ncbi:CRISPR-associated protein, Cse2 family [Erwinia amylovora Ea644]|uniref:type I-E CRISPR-associated protein Cse2/CasB n=1 Tax=Erwinia amylovora TaxID=552 RepID=UPI0002C9395A|nr:type I-E CRISPR-associated protein Cse2/CasB [Erwinia amylovora]CCP01684.1 CRISPR-associated protein, Cse2 family [Erwinia amylovora Ea644]CCP05680.1 CRISPR-associated protein, Cse2 family [Erwinia amylovora MR1]
MELPSDAKALYENWLQLDPGSKAKIRRATQPDDLMDIPAFYLLVAPFGWPQQRYALLRMVFCLSAGKIRPSEDDKQSIGRVFADKGISQPRIFQVIRADYPNDMVQLRRLIIHAEPEVYWPGFAQQLYGWYKSDRRKLLEDFVITTAHKTSRKDAK